MCSSWYNKPGKKSLKCAHVAYCYMPSGCSSYGSSCCCCCCCCGSAICASYCTEWHTPLSIKKKKTKNKITIQYTSVRLTHIYTHKKKSIRTSHNKTERMNKIRNRHPAHVLSFAFFVLHNSDQNQE